MIKYLECACYSTEHVMKFSLDEDSLACTDAAFLFVHTQLIPAPWYKRIWQAIKHVFGYQCRYGVWDEFIFTEESATAARDLLNRYLEALKHQNEHAKLSNG